MKQFEINTPLGHKITLTEFPSNNSNKIVVICSATGVLQGYYFKFASFLRDNGFTVYTFDYAGIGLSKKGSLKKFKITLSNWATNDIESVFTFIKKSYPNKKINCLSHSLGGQLLGLTPSNKLLNTIVLVASQINHFSFWNDFKEKINVFTNWYILFPFFTTFFKVFPSKKITKMEDLPRNVAREFGRWSRRKNHYFDLKDKDELLHHQITGNLFSYSCSDDKFAPKNAVDWLTNKYEKAKVTRRHLIPESYNVTNIGHFGFFKSKFRDTIWKEFLNDLQL